MDSLFLSLSLTAIVLSLWILPNVYPVAGTLLLSLYAGYLGEISYSSIVVIFILAFAGYHFTLRNGDKNTVLRIILLMLVFWALLNEDYDGRMITWSGYMDMITNSKKFIVTLNFEKILAATLLASYLYRPKLSLQYWQKIFTSAWSILFLVYVALLLPLTILLHFFVDFNIGNGHLNTLLLNVFLVAFAEEVLFRGVLQNWLTQIIRIKIGVSASWIAIMLVSVLYGLVHVKYGFFIVLFSILVGGAYGYVYRKSGKIEVAILVHFAFSLTFCFVLAYYGHSDYLPVVVY